MYIKGRPLKQLPGALQFLEVYSHVNLWPSQQGTKHYFAETNINTADKQELIGVQLIVIFYYNYLLNNHF